MPYSSLIAEYSSKELNDIFSTKNRFSKWVSIWQAQIKTLVNMGYAEQKEYDEISKVKVDDTLVKMFQEYENKTGHDINAGIKYLSELCPTAAKHIHAGMTSMDVDDNERVLLMRDGLEYLINKFEAAGFEIKPFELKGKKVSGAIGHSEDLIKFLGSKEKAAEFSKRIMDYLKLPYFGRTTQIYQREQDLALGNYLLRLADKIKDGLSVTPISSDFYPMMVARVNTLFNNASEDIDHRTIADSVSRRVEIPELFMLLDGFIDHYTASVREHSSFVNPLSRYASKEFVDAVSKNDLTQVKFLLKKGLVNCVYNLSNTLLNFKDVVYVARTHLQPAELTTIGRYLGLTLDKLVKYVERVDGLEEVDDYCDLISELGGSLSTFSNTLVFKQSQGQWSEPFKPDQVGSSVMAYKNNPNKTERIRGLARMIFSRIMSIKLGAKLARTIDFPELLLIADSIINNFNYIFGTEVEIKLSDAEAIKYKGMRIDPVKIAEEVDIYKSNILQTDLLAKAAKLGAKREKVYNELRDIKVRGEGINSIRNSKHFQDIFGNGLNSLIDSLDSFKPKDHVGTSIEDADDSLADANLLLDKYPLLIDKTASTKLTV